MDRLSLQRNLSTLENRYRELREISESRLQAGEADKTLLKQQIEQLNSELADVKACAQQLDPLRFKLRQANEQIDLIHQKLDSTEQESQINYLRFEQTQEERRQAQEELRQTQEELRQTQEELRQTQEELRQTQEELRLKSGNLQYLQSWRHQTEYSIKNQLKLIRKTLAIRFIERFRWILPTGLQRSIRQGRYLSLK